MPNIFSSFKMQVFSRSFFSWDYQLMTKKERIEFINGAYQCYLDILLSEKIESNVDRFRGKVITEDIYKDFVWIFDGVLYQLRENENLPENFWNKINCLWLTVYYFKFYHDEFENAPVNKLPKSIHNEWLEREKILQKKLLQIENEKMFELTSSSLVKQEKPAIVQDQKQDLSLLNTILSKSTEKIHFNNCTFQNVNVYINL